MTSADFDPRPPRDKYVIDGSMVVDVDGYAGPLDLLLELTREGKVEIRNIPVDTIAAQFLTFVETRLAAYPIEAVTEWLVVAAVLVQMKSRLLLPVKSKARREIDEAVEDLAERLHRLSVARELAELLAGGAVLGRDWHRPVAAAAAVGVKLGRLDLTSLLRAYRTEALRPQPVSAPAIVRHVFDLVTVKDAVRRLREILGASTHPVRFLDTVRRVPRDASLVRRRSAVTSAFVAVLGSAKAGQADFSIDETTLAITQVRSMAQ